MEYDGVSGTTAAGGGGGGGGGGDDSYRLGERLLERFRLYLIDCTSISEVTVR